MAPVGSCTLSTLTVSHGFLDRYLLSKVFQVMSISSCFIVVQNNHSTFFRNHDKPS